MFKIQDNCLLYQFDVVPVFYKGDNVPESIARAFEK